MGVGYPNQVAEPNLNPDIDPELEQAMMSLKKKYKEVFDYEIELKPMKGKPAKIELKDEVIKPLHINVPRRVPYAFEDAAKAELDRLVRLGVLAYVPGSSAWVNPMSFVEKPDGGMRLVADLVKLNQYVKRPLNPFKCVNDIISGLGPDAKWFAVVDCKMGYWQN